MRHVKNVAIAHETLPRPEMLLPRKTIMKSSPIRGFSSSGLERPVGVTRSGPERPIGAFYLFMRDFKNSQDCNSAVMKAGAEKWDSLTEAEKAIYELKVLDRSTRYMKYIEAFRKLNQDVHEDHAEPASEASSEKICS